MNKLYSPPKIETRFRRKLNRNYKPKLTPRLKQLYIGKYVSIQSQQVVRWQDMFKVGYSTCPGLFLHSLALPEFVSEKGISRLPFLLLTAFNISEFYLNNRFPDAKFLGAVLKVDARVVRDSLRYCLDRNFVMKVNAGFRGNAPEIKTGNKHYCLTILGQEVLNEYFLHCHQYYDNLKTNLVSDESNRYRNF